MRFILGLLLVVGASCAFAQIPNSSSDDVPTPTEAPHRHVSVNGGAVRINYGQPRWNKDPKTIDTAVVIMREAATGKIIQIQLTETAPDSSIFSGLYSINFANVDKLETEFYIPSQAIMAQKDGLMKITRQIQEHKIDRNPFILRRQIDGEQSIEIFDTKDQARKAMQAYKAEQLVTLQNAKPTKFPSDQDLDAEKVAEEQRAREEAAKAASERARLEQVEAARLADMVAKQKALDEKQREERRGQATAIAADGLELYKGEDFDGAREKFDQAIALDPDNHEYYYQYGVTLYKLGDYNRSLVLLGLAKGDSVNAVEKNYFVALNHTKLKETDAAIKAFDDVIASKDPVMAPSAQFYKGSLLAESEDYEGARVAFQAVLDTSKDPLLDERAEGYLESMLRAQKVADERKHKWSLSATIGEMYDSNVLLSSTSQQDSGTASNTAGWRTLLSGSARYRPVYDETKEFAAQLDVVTLYTSDKSFKYDQSLHNADPTVTDLTLPFTHKGTWLGKAHKLDIIPGYESTVMSIDNNVTKSIINSALLTFSNLLVMNEKWFNTVALDIRSDNSNLSTSLGDDDSTALLFRGRVSNLLFMNDKKDHILIPEGALTLNEAQGRNAFYERADIAVSYLIPTWKETTTNFKLGYFFLDYPTKSPAIRADNSYTATVGISKKLSEILNGGFLASYNINSSNEDANTYNKFTALLTLSAAYGF